MANFKFKNYQEVQKFQEGGTMPTEDPAMAGGPAPEGAPAPEQGGGDPMTQLVELGNQALQTQDCNLAMQFVQIVLQQLGAGTPSPEQAPEGQAPVFKRGGRLSRMVPKN